MQSGTLMLIVVAAIAALALVLFQYYHKAKRRGRLGVLLAVFRFLVFFCTFLVLINPKFTKNTYEIEKANLVLLADNSSSIQASDGPGLMKQVIDRIKENGPLADRFNLKQHSFGTGLNLLDSLSFSEQNTNIAQAVNGIAQLYGHSNTSILLLTDGNQTLGEDYEFNGTNQKFPIFPVAIGDTTRYEDLRVGQINANKYAFLKNKYPLEIYVSYEGKGSVTTNVNVSIDGKRVFREKVELSNTLSTKVISTLLEAKTVGVKRIRVSVEAVDNERNKANNHKNLAVEVIDEKTKIAIVTDVLHPDIGALKKAIEVNEQRSVTIRKVTSGIQGLEDMDLFILYQPNTAFKATYDYINRKKVNTFTITGPKTDWNFLNQVQNCFEKNSYNQAEEIVPVVNPSFSIFNNADFSVTDFPPLKGMLGEIIISRPHEVLLSQRIKGVELDEPLLAVLGSDRERQAVLFGEHLWKWRVQSFRNEQRFSNFDDMIGRIIRYLSTNASKSRLTVEYESLYSGANQAKVSAAYFDKAFGFDANATLSLRLKGDGNDVSREIPMLLKGNYYEADLSDLPAGSYDFTVAVAQENLSRSGSFSISDFDVEKQLLSSDYQKLDRLAQRSNGKLYFPRQTDSIIADLLRNDQFLPTQKSKQNVVSLIDFRFLLGVIIAALAAEWFIRKYNGLI